MLIRYPGSKDKHLRFLRPYILTAVERNPHLVEPFAGTAAISFELLGQGKLQSYVINDLDPAMGALWRTVKTSPDLLIEAVNDFTPNVDDFYRFKEDSGNGDFELAFRKIVLHQTSYSGLGAMAGGPLGGRHQRSAYGVDCRWRPQTLAKNILKCSELLNSVKGAITSLPWETVLAQYADSHFVYLDPPYYVKGSALYASGTIDHEGLAKVLKNAKEWVLSYDDAPEVRALYSWAKVNRLDVRSHLHHRVIGDLVITPNP